jgi:membrane associated rhomboid family serine protease
VPRYPSRSASPSSFSFGPGPLSTSIKTIIAVNVAIFIASSDHLFPTLQTSLGLVPSWVESRLQIWRLATYMFVHADVFHILFNMLALWMFGTELERMWGTRFFLKFYFIAGVGAALLTLLVSHIPYPPLQALSFSNIVGASGAIYGLLLAYALYFPDRIIYYFVFPVPVRVYVIISGALAFYASVSANGGGVASATHLGGLLIAWVYLTTLRKGPRLRLNPWAEVKYRWVKWRLANARKKFDVYSGGRDNGPDRWRVH